jgi:hypothetical protein
MAKTKRRYYPYQVPLEIYEKLEQRARKIRKNTGDDHKWTDVLKNILLKALK